MNIRNVPDELLKRSKIAAIEQGVTLREFVFEALEAAIANGKRGPKRK